MEIQRGYTVSWRKWGDAPGEHVGAIERNEIVIRLGGRRKECTADGHNAPAVCDCRLDGRWAMRHRHGDGRMRVLERVRDDHHFRKAIKLALVRQALLTPGFE